MISNLRKKLYSGCFLSDGAKKIAITEVRKDVYQQDTICRSILLFERTKLLHRIFSIISHEENL